MATGRKMDRANRLKRLKIRAWRRGTKEMDLILGKFTDAQAADMSDEMLDHLEVFMEENDHDLYQWISGQTPAPQAFDKLVKDIAQYTTPDLN